MAQYHMATKAHLIHLWCVPVAAAVTSTTSHARLRCHYHV